MLTMLGYLSKHGTQSEDEKNLFYDLWTLLKGEQSQGVTYQTIKKIILTIHGFHKGNENKKTNDECDPHSDTIHKRIGNIMNEDFTDCEISKSQAILIQRLFKKFNFNKIQNKQKGDVIKSQAYIKDECSFKPKLSMLSNQLAEKARDNEYTGNFKFYEAMTQK